MLPHIMHPCWSNNVELRSRQGQNGKEDELTLCVVDSVGRQSRVSSNAVVGRKPRWDRPTRSGGEPQRVGGQESGVGYSDRGPEGDPACHQFGLSKKAMARSPLHLQRCNTSTPVNRPLSTQHSSQHIGHQASYPVHSDL